MKTNTKTQLVANRAKKGYDKATSFVILNQLLIAHDGDNLIHALVYNSFATETQAAKLVK
jgi:hypothetical protein